MSDETQETMTVDQALQAARDYRDDYAEQFGALHGAALGTLAAEVERLRRVASGIEEARKQLRAKLRRFEEREPLVQEILQSIANSDPDECVSCIDVEHPNKGPDGHVYPKMHARRAAREALLVVEQRFRKPSETPTTSEASEANPVNAGESLPLSSLSADQRQHIKGLIERVERPIDPCLAIGGPQAKPVNAGDELQEVAPGIVECPDPECGAPCNRSDVSDDGVCRYCDAWSPQLERWMAAAKHVCVLCSVTPVSDVNRVCAACMPKPKTAQPAEAKPVNAGERMPTREEADAILRATYADPDAAVKRVLDGAREKLVQKLLAEVFDFRPCECDDCHEREGWKPATDAAVAVRTFDAARAQPPAASPVDGVLNVDHAISLVETRLPKGDENWGRVADMLEAEVKRLRDVVMLRDSELRITFGERDRLAKQVGELRYAILKALPLFETEPRDAEVALRAVIVP